MPLILQPARFKGKQAQSHEKHCIFIGSGYGYGTVPGGRWTIGTEGGHVVVSVSLIRNGYEYGTVPHLRGTIHTESGHVVNSISEYVVKSRSGYEPRTATVNQLPYSDDLDTPRAPSILCCL